MERLLAVLLVVVLFGIAALVLFAIIRRVVAIAVNAGTAAAATATSVGKATSNALASGGISLLAEDPRADLTPYRLTTPRTKVGALVQVVATGGLSLFVDYRDESRDNGAHR